MKNLNSESLNELENSETEVNLKQFLLKNPIYCGKLHPLLLRMTVLKVFLAIVDDFN